MSLRSHSRLGLQKKALSGRAVPVRPAPFKSVDDLLGAATQMLVARHTDEMHSADFNLDSNEMRDARKKEKAYARFFHQSLALTPGNIPIRDLCLKHALTPIECETILVLALARLGVLWTSVANCGDVLDILNLSAQAKLAALRSLRPDGRLHHLGLVFFGEEEEDVRELEVAINADVVEAILSNTETPRVGWPVTSEEELYRHLRPLTVAFYRRAVALDDELGFLMDNSSATKARRTIQRLLRGLNETLQLHPDWSLQTLLNLAGDASCCIDRAILLLLLGKELRHFRADHPLFKGGLLAAAVTDSPEKIVECLDSLKSDGTLVQQGLIQPCGGIESVLRNDADELREVEFELTEKAMEILHIDKHARRIRTKDSAVREAVIGLDQLVLSKAVSRAMDMAIAHARNARRLTDEWGLGSVIPYGRSVTLLFAGPPGVGKTACAEALAHELGRPILVADYSKIQNCYVGGTEKNIAKSFREARRHNAVLFWDEADAMFYNRDDGQHTWEVRDVNVLLQEIERFEGVCILATNRKTTLDPALERRITVNVTFERPDRQMRRQIWAKLLPEKMPLDCDIDFDELSEADLTGGEIKNVVLNAARLAITRDNGIVSMSDFRQALQMGQDGRLDNTHRKRIGFFSS